MLAITWMISNQESIANLGKKVIKQKSRSFFDPYTRCYSSISLELHFQPTLKSFSLKEITKEQLAFLPFSNISSVVTYTWS